MRVAQDSPPKVLCARRQEMARKTRVSLHAFMMTTADAPGFTDV
jgi:hypothetical protein